MAAAQLPPGKRIPCRIASRIALTPARLQCSGRAGPTSSSSSAAAQLTAVAVAQRQLEHGEVESVVACGGGGT